MLNIGFMSSLLITYTSVVIPIKQNIFSIISLNSTLTSNAILTFTIVAPSVFCARVFPSVKNVSSIIGSFFGVFICFVLPSISYLKAYKKDTNRNFSKIVATLFGITLCILGLASTAATAGYMIDIIQ